MITVTEHSGRRIFLAPAAIASVSEAGPASAWHGIQAYVRTFDGKTLEVQEAPESIAKQVEAAQAP